MKIIRTENLTPKTALNPDETSWVYNGLDCCVTLEVWEKLQPNLTPRTRETYKLSKALQGPILDMNMHGILVDAERLEQVKAEIVSKVARLERQLKRILIEGYGFDLNWRSPTQLKDFLYNYLLLPVQRKRNSNGKLAPTADRAALENLSHHFSAAPLISHMLVLRDLGKKLGFLETEIDADGYMRCNFNIAGTNTGRLASSYSDFGSGTNLQNVDRTLRRIFIPPVGKKFVNLDLEQADSRNVGASCWNKFLASHGAAFAGAYLDACESGDLHTLVTRMGWPELNWGTDERLFRSVADQNAYRNYSYRDLAKRLGHGTNYYGKPPTMAKHSKIPVRLAEEFQRRYFSAFPCIRAGHEWTARELATTACITTILGRQRYFFGRANDDRTLREAIAYEGQSATADEINFGLLNLWRGGNRFPGFQLLAQVHDSVLFEVDEAACDEATAWALEALRVPIELAGGRQFIVPTEAKVGWNWGDVDADNPDGLRKWKGGDNRQRVNKPSRRRW